MSQPVSALLIGDQELDRVEILLRNFGVDFERVRVSRPTLQLQSPRRLLVVAGSCITRMPTLLPAPGGGQPLRVCMHNQDFLPLRERLRDLGFHYLVQTALDETSLRVFFEQLLHPATSQRSSARLPLGVTIDYDAASGSGSAKLLDLSIDSCRIGAHALRIDEAVTVVLPAALGGGSPLALHGHATRRDTAGDAHRRATVIRFGVQDAGARERLERIVQGKLIGTRVTPLVPETLTAAGASPAPPADRRGDSPVDRRREVRHPYQGRVEVLELPGGGEGALGRDLSLAGVRIAGGHPLRAGMKLTLALYGGRGGEPAIQEAEVVRVNGAEAALVFGRLSEPQQDRIAALIAEPPALASLEASQDPSGRVVPTRILRKRG